MTISAQQLPEQVIEVEHLSKSFGKVRTVVDLSFSVREGEIFGFLGPNGAGKTTTLAILEGLLKVDGGRAVVLGMDIATSARAIKQRIGVQVQSTSLLPDLTVAEQMLLFARLYGRSPNRSDITGLLQQVGLNAKTAVLPDKLSGGQQRRALWTMIQSPLCDKIR